MFSNQTFRSGVSALQTSLALPPTASLGACSTLPGTLDQGCLYCRLASVLPLEYLQTNLVLNQLSDQGGQSIACHAVLSTRCLQESGPWDQGGVYMADQSWC